MKRPVLLLIAVGLLAWSVGLVATLPAARALAWFSPSGIQATGVSGTIWQGGARHVDTGVGAPLSAVSWDVSAWRLLTGRIVVDTRFRFAGIEGEGVVTRGFAGGWSGRALALRGPVARAASQLAGDGMAVELRGQMLARMAQVAVEGGSLRALEGRAQWSDAGLVAPIPLELGSVRADAAPSEDGPGFRIEIEGSGGDLDIDGAVDLQPDGRYSADLRLTPTGQAPAGLRETLGMAARRSGDGFRLRHNGRIPGLGGR